MPFNHLYFRFTNEIQLLKRASHRNVVRVEGYTSCESGIAIVMEYMPGRSLDDLLMSKRYDDKFLVENIPCAVKLRFCTDIACGITYLHLGFGSQRIVHGDLKPANILLAADLTCKICDFGGADFATITENCIDTPKVQKRTEYTQGFVAPERLQDSSKRVSKAMDVYSVGVIFYAILTRKNPPPKADDFKTILDNYKTKADSLLEIENKAIGNCLKEAMLKCAECDAQKRPEIREVRDELQVHMRTVKAADIAQHVASILKVYKLKDLPAVNTYKSLHKAGVEADISG